MVYGLLVDQSNWLLADLLPPALLDARTFPLLASQLSNTLSALPLDVCGVLGDAKGLAARLDGVQAVDAARLPILPEDTVLLLTPAAPLLKAGTIRRLFELHFVEKSDISTVCSENAPVCMLIGGTYWPSLWQSGWGENL